MTHRDRQRQHRYVQRKARDGKARKRYEDSFHTSESNTLITFSAISVIVIIIILALAYVPPVGEELQAERDAYSYDSEITETLGER